MKGLIRSVLDLEIENHKKKNNTLVDGNDFDILVEQGITKDDTADTTFEESAKLNIHQNEIFAHQNWRSEEKIQESFRSRTISSRKAHTR